MAKKTTGQAVRPNREVDKPKVSAPKTFPKEGRITCRVLNIENPGQPIDGCVCGINFTVQHGATVELHPAQIAALQNTLIDTTRYEEQADGSFAVVPVQIPRIMVEVFGIPGMKKAARPAAGTKTRPVAEPDNVDLPPGVADTPGAVSSGR